MENELRGLKKVLDNIAVISRAVDKLLTDLTITCPQHYQERCAKMFIENDAYTVLTNGEFAGYGAKICVVAFWQRHNEIVGAGSFCCVVYVFDSGSAVTISDVVGD